MKRIINGMTYDTTTATKIASLEREAGKYNPESSRQILYKTLGGAFFMHEHKERTYYDKQEEEWRTEKTNKFRLMSREDTHNWIMEDQVEIHNEDEFGLPPEAVDNEPPSATIYLRVPKTLMQQIDNIAREENQSINAWAMRCIESCIKSEGN